MTTLSQITENKYWQYALWLALFTVFYNFAEGLISIYFGAQDETLTLFGFGVDSFIEVMSGVGILAMVLRIRQNPGTPRSQFEQTALRITGTSFYILAAGLGATGIYNLFTGIGHGKTQSRACPCFRSHPGRRELHNGLYLYVCYSTGLQPYLSIYRVWANR